MKLIHFPESEHKFTIKKAEAILNHKPEIILFEMPEGSIPDFNKYEALEKPKQLILEWEASLKKSSKMYPWLKSEILVVKAINQLWNSGHQVLIYEIDGPQELTSLAIREEITKKGIMNQVWNFLRELYMVEKIKKHIQDDKKILVFLHDFHWNNVQFLLTNPSSKRIFNYSFRRSGYDNPQQVRDLIENKMLLTFWDNKNPF
ncbi:hypothetical protein HON71_00920 [Candidatus Woesearchaeota archaeon]|jgi:hypothetical protein|nr:hypothetical protein [Candidatus Woesearchaeota archaeon]MBT5343180.1 hypothetical protein [Candidatus Woesearchaeota archaeon]